LSTTAAASSLAVAPDAPLRHVRRPDGGRARRRRSLDGEVMASR
jgi:hypothetical protein